MRWVFDYLMKLHGLFRWFPLLTFSQSKGIRYYPKSRFIFCLADLLIMKEVIRSLTRSSIPFVRFLYEPIISWEELRDKFSNKYHRFLLLTGRGSITEIIMKVINQTRKTQSWFKQVRAYTTNVRNLLQVETSIN